MYIDVVQVNSSPGPNADHTPQNFFISRFIEDQENIEVLDPSERLYERWEDLLHDERNKLEERLSTFENSIGERLTDVLFESIEREMGIPRRGPETIPPAWTYTGTHDGDDISTVAIQLERERGYRERRRRGRISHRRHPPREDKDPMWIIISNTTEDASVFLNYLRKEIDDIERMVSDFVKLDTFNRGEQIVKNYFDRLVEEGDYVTDWYVEETEDEFETEVYETVNSLTGICLPNINIKSTIGESPEYDVVTLPLGPISKSYVIEAKNYDREEVDETEFGNLRYKLITQPKEKAERVGLDLITVAKGLDDGQYDNLKRHADPSDVLLLNADNYKSELEHILIEQNLPYLARALR